MHWKKISSKYIRKHPYFTAREDVCEMPNGHLVNPYYVVELPNCVCAVAITEDDKIVMKEKKNIKDWRFDPCPDNEKAFCSANSILQPMGINLYNAGVGGNLRALRRVDFKELF